MFSDRLTNVGTIAAPQDFSVSTIAVSCMECDKACQARLSPHGVKTHGLNPIVRRVKEYI